MKSWAAALRVSRVAEDDPAVPRTAYVSPEAIGDAQGGIVSGLVYAGATAAAGTVLISGGTIVAAVVAATLVGGSRRDCRRTPR